MIENRALDLVCVSYLADVEVLRVASYPRVNSGAIVDHVDTSIAADGPLTAITAARLDMRVGLVANAVGADPAGRRLLDRLTTLGIRHTIAAVADTTTPRLTVVDDTGTRMWFALPQRAPAELGAANLHLLADARLIYLDCYRVLGVAATRVLAAASSAPLLLNLGGDPLDDSIIAASLHRRITAVQTSLEESDTSGAEALATSLFERLRPDAAVVTMGRLGALARTSTGIYRAAAPPVVVTHTHGAGAAFSAGYAHALLAGADIETALRAACELGAAHCANPNIATAHSPTTRCAVDAQRHLLYELTQSALADARLLRLCEHYDILDKIVLHDATAGWRLRLHIFLPGYFDRPHNHRWTYSSRILAGSYTHSLYGADDEVGDDLDPGSPVARMVRIERPGYSYTLHHSMIHSVVAEPYTVSLVVRGPAVKDRFIVTDRSSGKAWWQHGAASEHPVETARKRMTVGQVGESLERLTEGIFR